MNIVSLFSGIGGFEVGINKSNLNGKIVFSSEIDKYASTAYLSNFNNNNLVGDITKISEREIPNHELLVAGFPCQAFSIAGKQNGFNDIRGTLFFDIARILKEKKPKYILLENVKNLVSHNKGDTFKTIITILNSIGYTIDFTIINSLEAGLPQNRERTYIVGILNGFSSTILTDKRNKNINKIKSTFKYNGFDFFNTLYFTNRQKYILDILENTNEKKYMITNDYITSYLQNNIIHEEYILQNKIVKLFDLPKELWNDLERQRRVYSIYGISPTILARTDTTKVLIKKNNELYIRKFTPKENFRIQGFDDDFIDNISKVVSISQQYKQAGNAVSPPVITGILNHLIKFMENK